MRNIYKFFLDISIEAFKLLGIGAIDFNDISKSLKSL